MIVAFLGLKGSGKDTVAQRIVSGAEDVYIVKFAAGIKKILLDYFNLGVSVYEDSTLKESKTLNGRSPRDLMIDIGLLFRKYAPNVWVETLDSKITKIQESAPDEPLIFVTDLRFPNEYDYLVEKGAIIIDLNRPQLYALEKKVISKWGVNWFSKLLIWKLNSSLVKPSEWNYFKLRKRKEVLYLENNDLDRTIEELKKILLGHLPSENSKY